MSLRVRERGPIHPRTSDLCVPPHKPPWSPSRGNRLLVDLNPHSPFLYRISHVL